MGDRFNLNSLLLKLDGANYKAYKDLDRSYQFEDFRLIIDRVQGDPFAAPSQMRIIMTQAVAGYPAQLYRSKSREIATRDYIARQFANAAQKISTRRGTGKSGLIAIAPLGQEVLKRSAVLINSEELEVRFVLGLPARGRRILGRQAAAMLCEDLPELVNDLLYESLDAKAIQQHVETIEDADHLRQQLPQHKLVAFVANGAILPRRSGVDSRPLLDAIAFKSPTSMEVELTCPNRGVITGMGIPEGITLIVGGGYHGKSTLLKAIELGVYNHLPGDGREYVVSNPQGMKIRAEDGRAIAGVDISPFINHLPQQRSTTKFSTTNASGSTSQAANIIEALEAGAKLLLIDEDTSATNFTIRDRRMQALIAKEREPITPFIDKVRQLYNDYRVSTILVMGGSGDYFEVADRVIALDSYQPQDVTTQAKAIATEYATGRNAEGGSNFGKVSNRIPLMESIDPSRGKGDKLTTRRLNTITLGREEIDLSAVEQLVDPGQLKAIAKALIYLKNKYPEHNIAQILSKIEQDIRQSGLNIIADFPHGDLAFFRTLELAAALNRLRSLEVK
ncbi:MAG: ABC-ATPase domain-containing protein [Cyanobacteria bacterium P01_G01_bin.39]